MTTEEALRIGFIVSGPILAITGFFFAVAISASPYHNIAGKAVGWPLSPVAGLVSGAHFGGTLLPGLEYWGVAWFFGPGFFAIWMCVGTLTHDDVLHAIGEGIKKLWPVLRRKLKERTAKTSSSGTEYRAYANRTMSDGGGDGS